MKTLFSTLVSVCIGISIGIIGIAIGISGDVTKIINTPSEIYCPCIKLRLKMLSLVN